MKRLKNRITLRVEIKAGRLVRVHVYDPETKCPVCSEPNPLKSDLWVLITDQGLNDIQAVARNAVPRTQFAWSRARKL